MKHLQTFNERNLFIEKFKDDHIILQIIKSIKEVCPPKNLKNIFYKASNIKPKFTIKAQKHEKFQTITFFTTIKEDIKKPIPKKIGPTKLNFDKKPIFKIEPTIIDKDDFYIANVELDLYYVPDFIGSFMYIVVYVNDVKLICNDNYRDALYSLLCDYIKKNNL